MHRVEITGTPARLPRLNDVEGVKVVRSSFEQLADGSSRVGGYATDDQIARLEKLGLVVRIVEDAEERRARLIEMGRQIRESRD
jgi:hypothetical protein